MKSAIADSVVDFAIAKGMHRQFHIEELRSKIGEDRAPDSPGRILRALRQDGVINYRVISRANSLYEFIPAKEAA